jgi:hypothetical protein
LQRRRQGALAGEKQSTLGLRLVVESFPVLDRVGSLFVVAAQGRGCGIL